MYGDKPQKCWNKIAQSRFKFAAVKLEC